MATRTTTIVAGLLILGLAPAALRAGAPPRLSIERATEELHAALQIGAEGNSDDRQASLATLLKGNPDFAPAHWQSGEVLLDNHWTKYDELVKRVDYQTTLARYAELRDRDPLTATRHMELADWCAENGLFDRERFHLYSALEQQPCNRKAIARLGFVRHWGRWVNPPEIASFRDQEQAATKSLTTWAPLMKQTAAWLPKQDSPCRREALAKFQAITDPAAISAMQTVLFPIGAEAASLVIEQWGRMKSPEAAYVLAQVAVFHPDAKLATKAAKQLHDKPEDSYVPLLLSALSSSIEHQYEFYQSPDGDVIARHRFTREVEDRRLVVEQQTAFKEDRDAEAGPIGQTPAQRESLQAKALDQQVAAQNAQVEKLNDRIYATLAAAIGADIPHDPADCWNWWYDRNEVYISGSKPVVSESESSTIIVNLPRKYDCLAAGTPIWTDRGLIAVEKIKPGDRVLSQHPQTGELAYKIVYQTTVRPPEQLVKIETSGGPLVASGGHPFWVIGKGWVRARLLPSGDRLYGIGGEVRVTSVANDTSRQPSYNLLVADFHTYFAGEQKVLSHDNTVRQPVSASVPGLLVK